MITLVPLTGRHASDLEVLAADDWDAFGFVARALRLRARRERETLAVFDGKRLVGLVMLGRGGPDRGQAELGYWIGGRERGRGYAFAAAQQLVSRAFTTKRLRLVFAHCADDNPASARVLAKLGFRMVADAAAGAGETVKRYELTAAEWSARS